MRIKYFSAKNFLSIGPDPVEIDLTKYGSIICVKGKNLDQGAESSNGAGKSTLIEIIVYALFGKLIKNLNHKQAINIKTKKNLEVEVHFDHDGHEYKIIRKREKDSLEFWKDGKNESTGGIPAIQEEISKTIRLTYDGFINVVCFGQHNTRTFLSCEAGDKRKIAENLLSLDKYVKYCETAKKKQKTIQDSLKSKMTVYELQCMEEMRHESQIKKIAKQQDEWKASQLNAIERLRVQISKMKTEMAKVNAPATSNLDNIQALQIDIEEKQRVKQRLMEGLHMAETKTGGLKEDRQNVFLRSKELIHEVSRLKKEIGTIEQQSQSLITREGSKCPACYAVIRKENFKSVLEYNQRHAFELKKEINELEGVLAQTQGKLQKLDEALGKMKSAYDDAKTREVVLTKSLRELEQRKVVAEASYRENTNSATLILEQQINALQEQMSQKQQDLETGDPYGQILFDAKVELSKVQEKCAGFKLEIMKLEEQVPYYDFWIKAFGDNGIRSFVIDEVIPILNSRINYWLQFLVDNKIKLTFNSKLAEKIERNPSDGDPFVYEAMSGGEHNRIDLGISQAFANVTMLTSGTCPSICCLDEVGTNLDRPGIQAVYNMICELARERQVLVTTHDPDLLEMLSGYDTITAIKQNGYTRLEKTQ